MIEPAALDAVIRENVRTALAEDIGQGDVTAALIPADSLGEARVITREPMVMAGRAWVDEVFRQLDSRVSIHWAAHDGDAIQANGTLFTLHGPARSLLTGERTALNFVQLLAGIATRVNRYAQVLQGTHTRLLDTRKTIPGLRLAQKYAVTVGGGQNHRLGLYDAFLIKENHIMAAGSIEAAVEQAHQIAPGKPVEVEVESQAELEAAILAGADIVMLDNFDLPAMKAAVAFTAGRVKLEASGGISNVDALRAIAEAGVDYVSLGTLTKDVSAVDLSMRFLNKG